MAIAFGASLGSAVGAASPASSWAFNTSATVPAGGQIIVGVGWFSATATETVSGGGLTWVRDKLFSSASRNVSIWSATAPAGLASGTTITTNVSVASNTCGSAGMYVTGVDSTTDSTGTGSATSNTWSASVATVAADTIVVKFGWVDFLATSATQDATNTEWADFTNTLDTNTFEGVYRIVSAAGTYAPGGTWTGSQAWVAAGVAYKASSTSTATATAPNPLLSMLVQGGVQKARALLLMQPAPVQTATVTATAANNQSLPFFGVGS